VGHTFWNDKLLHLIVMTKTDCFKTSLPVAGHRSSQTPAWLYKICYHYDAPFPIPGNLNDHNDTWCILATTDHHAFLSYYTVAMAMTPSSRFQH